jgi:hypothetical protein
MRIGRGLGRQRRVAGMRIGCGRRRSLARHLVAGMRVSRSWRGRHRVSGVRIGVRRLRRHIVAGVGVSLSGRGRYRLGCVRAGPLRLRLYRHLMAGMRICRGLHGLHPMPRMRIAYVRTLTLGMWRGGALTVGRSVAVVRSGGQPGIRHSTLRMGTQIASAAPRVT